MKNEERKRNFGLIGLYALLLLASCLVRQIWNHTMIVVILLIITLGLLVILWRYLLQNKIINVTWASVAYERNLHKSERLFVFGFVLLFLPVLKFRNISTSDVVTSILLIVVAVAGYIINEHHLAKKQHSN